MIRDNSKLMICPDCCEKHGKLWKAWIQDDEENSLTHNCVECGNPMIETNLTNSETSIILKISTDYTFLKAIMELKDNNPIDYQLKLNQFKVQIEQRKSIGRQEQNNSQLKCPTCGSDKIKKISVSAKIGGAMMFGIFSKTAKSQFKCEKCGYKW